MYYDIANRRTMDKLLINLWLSKYWNYKQNKNNEKQQKKQLKINISVSQQYEMVQNRASSLSHLGSLYQVQRR